MAKQPNPVRTEQFRVTIPEPMTVYLEQLAMTGAYGANSAEVIAGITLEALRKRMEQDGLLRLTKPKVGRRKKD
jgi:hypothetical protein